MENEKIILLTNKLNQTGKDLAYFERDMLVSLLSKIYPSYLTKHPESDTEWEKDWRNIVVINSPTGQLSWHIHDSELPFFTHLEQDSNRWDGHTNLTKYIRIGNIEQNQIYMSIKSIAYHLNNQSYPILDLSGYVCDDCKKIDFSEITDIVKKLQTGKASVRIQITKDE